MRGIGVIAARELRSYFISPVACALCVTFLALSGWFFWNLAVLFVQVAASSTQQAILLQQPPPVLNVNLDVVRPWFNVTSELLLFLTPILTMRLLSEERGTGRLDLLLSAPLTDLQLVLGKFLAGWVLCVVFLVPTAVYQGILFAQGSPELLPILSGYLGLLLLSAALVALGLFISSLTGSQAVAAAGGFGAAILLWIVGPLTRSGSSAWSGLLSSLSMLDRFGDFSNGTITTRSVCYFLSLVFFLLFLTLRTIESQRWRG